MTSSSDFDEMITRINVKHETAFKLGKTLSIEYRKRMLLQLISMLENSSDEIVKRFQLDYLKPAHLIKEEISYSISRIEYMLNNIDNWSAEKKVSNDVTNMNARLAIRPQPFGNVLIIVPWNYPIILSIVPLAGAISSGNTVVVKFPELTPHFSSYIEQLAFNYLDPECYTFISTAECGPKLVEKKFDFIFYTGSTKVGRSVYEAAARNLTPVVLELGGKCPCYIHSDANIKVAAEKIVHLKTSNAGQVCLSVNHVFCHNTVLNQFTAELITALTKFYTSQIKSSPDYGRIVTEAHTQRLIDIIMKPPGRIIFGGTHDLADRFVEPTLMLCEKDCLLLTEEIFGPILPIISVTDSDEALQCIREQPLNIYIFTYEEQLINTFKSRTSSGSLTINSGFGRMSGTFNNQIAINLPFGGVGPSGIGRYHGVESFNCFSNLKSIYHETFHISYVDDLMFPPYSEQKAKYASWALRTRLIQNCTIL